MMKLQSKRRGFTLIELVVVVLVIGILAAVAAPKILDMANNSRTSATRHSLTVVRDAIELYKSQNGSYPEAATLAADLKPFLKTAFPTCQVGNFNANVVATTETPITTVVTGGSAWVYNETTGEISVNHADGIGW